MERFYSSQRETVLLGLGFNDDNNNNNSNNSLTRSSSSTTSNVEVDFNDVFGGPPRRSSEGEGGGWCRWPRRVFGEDSGNRKKNEFFDDIFGGEESGSGSGSASVCSTPKKRGSGDTFTHSATHPVPVASLPLPFSLPAKLTNGVDLQTFGSPPRSRNPNNINDGIVASNGLGPSDFHLSRFSTQRKELKNDLKPYRQSLLSQEFSNPSVSDKVDKESSMKQDISISEVSPSPSSGQFHFSIYKWASKGVPIVMPLRTDRTSRTKDKAKLERCSSAREWMVSEITSQNPTAYNDSLFMNNRKEDVLTTSTATHCGADSDQIVEQIVTAKAQPDTSSRDVPASSVSRNAGGVESSTRSTSEIGFSRKTEAAKETQKLEPKPLHFLFKESDKKQDYDAMNTRERGESRMKSTKKLSTLFDATATPMKQEEKTVLLRDKGLRKVASQGSLNSRENMENGLVKGKVKEFARIFNQEAVTKPKVDSKSRTEGSTYKHRDAVRTKSEVEGGPEQIKKENSAIDTTNIFDDISDPAIPDISFTVIGDKDESFNGSFMIKVLSQDEGEVLQNQENQEIQIVDNKIKQWSKGKEGNIRSLLSTLQYVLWPECGWKPVPLVDIIERNAVKRAYQRALLCLHPDKLQQKGAASDQKYTAEKVFDILQEAWTQFNALGAL